MAVDWLPDETLLSMSSDGEINIWAAVAGSEDANIEFVQRRIKSKDKPKSAPMTVMKVCDQNLLITGDQSGIIKSWTIDGDDFQLLKSYDVRFYLLEIARQLINDIIY